MRGNAWLSFGLAFVGGYSDAASLVLADTFTGHITGSFVLAAVSVAHRDWSTFALRLTGIALFLAGVLVSALLERCATKPPELLLPRVMGVEIALIVVSYIALASHFVLSIGLFVSCMSLALGLQNSAWRSTGGISVHTTYLTGLMTDLVTTAAQRGKPADPKVGILCGIWVAFVFGAGIGAAMVIRFGALGIFGAGLVLLAIIVCLSSKSSRKGDRK